MVDSKRNTDYNYTYNSFNIKNIQYDKKWLFYPSQISNELQFVWFTDFLHLQSISNQSPKRFHHFWGRRQRDSSLGCGTELLSLSGTPPASSVIHTEPENKILFFLKVSHRYLWYIQKLWQRWSNMWAALSAKAHRDNF